MVYYNEWDPYCAQWLRNLIAAGHLPLGYVDERSIADVRPDEIRGFVSCHFFAGIGGWPLALRMAGWPDERPVWTGSCPCQPFSVAGKRRGTADERHLWPEFRHLIDECRPARVFGEQVASKDGREWLAGVRTDLEGLGYACGCADLCAASQGAPHIRQRLYWVAHHHRPRLEERTGFASGTRPQCATVERSGDVSGLADSQRESGAWRLGNQSKERSQSEVGRSSHDAGSDRLSFWSDYERIPCRDGKTRRTQSGLFPLAVGVSGRVGRLRAYGNAVVVPLAKEFILACEEALAGNR